MVRPEDDCPRLLFDSVGRIRWSKQTGSCRLATVAVMAAGDEAIGGNRGVTSCPSPNKQMQRARTNHEFVLGYVHRRVADLRR